MSLTTVTHVLKDDADQLLRGKLVLVAVGGDTGDGLGWRKMAVRLADGSEMAAIQAKASDPVTAALTWLLPPNAELTPANTYYRATLPDGSTHLFQVPVSGTPVLLSDLYSPGGDLTPDTAATLTAAVAGKAAKSANLSDLASASAARGNLGLGSAATQSSSAFDAAGAGTAAAAGKADKSANLSDLASASTARTNLGLGDAATHPASDFDAAGSATATGTTFAANKAARLAATTSRRVKQTDTLVEYLRSTVGGAWSRASTGDLVVPEEWAALDPITLSNNVQGAINACVSYQQTNRTATVASTTTAQRAIYTDPVGIGATLFFSPDVQWVCGVDDTMCTDMGQPLRRGAIRPYNGISLKGHRTRMAFWSPGGTGASSLITFGYRPWDETPLRQTGGTQPWSQIGGDQTLWKTGGQPGVSATPYKSWRYANAAVAYLTAAVVASDTTYTCTVDQVDGVQRAWAATYGITTQLMASGAAANPFAVGDLVARMQGQNPDDAHEILQWDVCQITAINGVTTPGYVATGGGAGTLTFDKPFNKASIDPATQVWTSYSPERAGAIATGVLPGDPLAVPNLAAIAIIKIDPVRWLRHPKITGFDFFTAPNPITGVASATPANQYIENNAFTYRPEVSDCRFWDALKQGMNHGYVTEPHGHDNEMMGSWTGTTNAAGMLFDFCSTRGGHYVRSVVRQPYGQAFQLESNSSCRFDNLTIEQTNPFMKTFGGTGTAAQFKSPIQLIGGSKVYIDGLVWSGATNFLVKRNTAAASETTAPCIIDGRVTVTSTRTQGAAVHFRGTEFAPGAEISVTMPNLAGTAQVTYLFEPSVSRREAGIGWGSATNYALLPPGWPRVSYISVNQSSLSGLTSLKLATGLGTTDIELLGGAIATHVTNPATDSVGDGQGSDADRTLVSSTGEFNAQISVDSVVTVHAGNLDGTDWITGVQTRTDASNVIVYDLPPKPITSGTTVSFDAVVVANKRVQLPAFATRLGANPPGGAGVGGWVAQKLEQEAAGVQSRLIATWAGGVTPTTGGIVLEMETRELRSVPGAVMPTFATSPPAVTDTTSLMAALRLRGVITDNTSGASIFGGSTPDATASVKGILQLAGDLGGTAASPTVPGLTGKANALTSVTGIKTSAYTANADEIVRCDASGGTFTVTLPAAPATGARVIVKKTDNSATAVTVATGGSDVFNKASVGPTSMTLAKTGASISAQYSSGNSVWVVTATDAGSGVAYTGDAITESQVTNLVTDLAAKAPTSRQVVAGTGLTGGGDLTADRTLTVAYGTTGSTAAVGNDSRITGAEQTSNKGATNGYAPLVSGTVPLANLPAAVSRYAASMTSVPTAISNTTTATALWSPATITTAQLAVGSAFRFEMGGTVTTVATSGAFTFRLRIGGTVIISTTIILSTTAAQTNLPWWADLSFTVYATGVSGSVGAAGLFQGINAAGASGVQTGFTPPTATTVDLSAGAAVTATIQMATANAGNSFQPLQASLIQNV